jgi:hypothetical protein
VKQRDEPCHALRAVISERTLDNVTTPYARFLIGPPAILLGAGLFWVQHGDFDSHGILIALSTYVVVIAVLLAIPITRRRVLRRR